MSKDKFLTELEQKLHVLNEQERKDVLEEYAQHIDLKIENGQSEEDAVSDFGSPEALAAELLDAYHINCEYASAGSPDATEKKQENNSGIGQSFGRTVSNAADNMRNKAGQAAKGAGKAVRHLTEGTGKAVQNTGKGIGRICVSMVRMMKLILEFLLGGIRGCGRAIKRLCCFVLRRPCPAAAGSSTDMETEEKTAGVKAIRVQKDTWKERNMQRQEKNDEDRISKAELRLERRRIRNEEARERMALIEERRMRGEMPLLVRGVQWCIHVIWLALLFSWKCCLAMVALPILFLGLLSLFLAGAVFVLLMQGYPLAGAAMVLVGMILSFLGTTALLLSWVFPGKKDQGNAVYAGNEGRKSGYDAARYNAAAMESRYNAAGYNDAAMESGYNAAGYNNAAMESGYYEAGYNSETAESGYDSVRQNDQIIKSVQVETAFGVQRMAEQEKENEMPERIRKPEETETAAEKKRETENTTGMRTGGVGGIPIEAGLAETEKDSAVSRESSEDTSYARKEATEEAGEEAELEEGGEPV